MFYIVGLGNPGEKYATTRHNVGWLALDYFCEHSLLPKPVMQKAMSGRTTEGVVEGKTVRVLYPETFMNNSGAAVAKLVPKEKAAHLIVIHDDIDIPFGEMKIVQRRGDGGNNGIKSIVAALQTKEFIRIRVGIAPKSFWTGKVVRPAGGGPLERFVLKPFSKSESVQLPEVFEDISGALRTIFKSGADAAMNQYN